MKKILALLILAGVPCDLLSQTVNASRGVQFNNGSTSSALLDGTVQLGTNTSSTYAAGQLSFDPTSKTFLADTGFDGVRVNVGQESHVLFYNGTGSTISNGTPINASTPSNGVLGGIVLDITNPILSSAFIGLATSDVSDGEVGLATILGNVRGLDTSTLTEGGITYAGPSGSLTNVFPNYPNRVVIVGSCVETNASSGNVFVDAQVYNRPTITKSYSFTQANVGSGDYYSAGFYDFSATDADLTQASTNVSFGSANAPHEAHAFIVSSGNGTVDTGQVGLRVRGASINTSTGAVTLNDTQVVTEDITAQSVDDYLETSKKWVGDISYELYVVSGSPTTYSYSFNYGFAKYEDFANNDFTVTGLEVVGTAGQTDATFNIELLKHGATGWTYAATGFEAGDGAIVSLSDQSPYDNLVSGEPFAFKRPALTTFVDGDGSEGIVIRITCGQNNSVQSMDLHVSVVIEELIF